MPGSGSANINSKYTIEKEWIGKVREGDKQAFEYIFRKYYGRLRRFASHMVQSDFIGEEIVQEVFSGIWANHSDWNPNPPLSNYLYRSVKNRSLNYLKRVKTERYYLDQIQKRGINKNDRDNKLKDSNFISEAHKAIDDLPERARMVYTLHRREGLNYREISVFMQISVKTVESQMSRALRILRRKLARYLP